MATPAGPVAPPPQAGPTQILLGSTALSIAARRLDGFPAEIQRQVIKSIPSLWEQVRLAHRAAKAHKYTNFDILLIVVELNEHKLFDSKERCSRRMYNQICSDPVFVAERPHAREKSLPAFERAKVVTRSFERNQNIDCPSVQARQALNIQPNSNTTWTEIIERSATSTNADDAFQSKLWRESDEALRYTASGKPQRLLEILDDFIGDRTLFQSHAVKPCSSCVVKEGRRSIEGYGFYCGTCRPSEITQQVIPMSDLRNLIGGNQFHANGTIKLYPFVGGLSVHINDADMLTRARFGVGFNDAVDLRNTSALLAASPRLLARDRMFLSTIMEIKLQYHGKINGFIPQDLEKHGLSREMMKVLANEFPPAGDRSLLDAGRQGHLRVAEYVESTFARKTATLQRRAEQNPRAFRQRTTASFWTEVLKNEVNRGTFQSMNSTGMFHFVPGLDEWRYPASKALDQFTRDHAEFNRVTKEIFGTLGNANAISLEERVARTFSYAFKAEGLVSYLERFNKSSVEAYIDLFCAASDYFAESRYERFAFLLKHCLRVLPSPPFAIGTQEMPKFNSVTTCPKLFVFSFHDRPDDGNDLCASLVHSPGSTRRITNFTRILTADQQINGRIAHWLADKEVFFEVDRQHHGQPRDLRLPKFLEQWSPQRWYPGQDVCARSFGRLHWRNKR